MLNYLLQSVTYSWLSFPPRCSTFSELTSLPSSLRCLFTRIHCNFWQLLWNMKSCHWPLLGAQTRRCLCCSASKRSLLPALQCESSAHWTRTRGVSMPAFLVSSRPSVHDISPHPWKPGEGRQKSVWAENEGKEFGDLVSQRDDLGKCVCLVSGWLGFAFSMVYIYFFLYMHISSKMEPVLPHGPAACEKQDFWLA